MPGRGQKRKSFYPVKAFLGRGFHRLAPSSILPPDLAKAVIEGPKPLNDAYDEDAGRHRRQKNCRGPWMRSALAVTPAARPEITAWARALNALVPGSCQTETALLPAPFWCTYAWNRPTSTGAGGSDPLWLCWRGKPSSRSAGKATPRPSRVNWNDN